MGNCLSWSRKESRLEDIEERYAATSSLLAARERELCDLRNQSQEVAKEASALHANGKRLEDELATLSQKYQEEVDGLKTDLRQKEEGNVARDRVVESIREERDEQRCELDNAKQQLGQLAEEKRELDDLLTNTKEHTSALLVSKDCQLENAREAISTLETARDKIANENSNLLDQLSTATRESTQRIEELKKFSEKELADQRSRAAHQLNSVRNEGQKQVAEAKALAERMTEQANAVAQASSTTVRTQTCPLPGTMTNVTYSQPVAFSVSGKDLRMEVCEYQHEVRVDIREWYGTVRSKKGVSIPVIDAMNLANMLPGAVNQAMQWELGRSVR